MRVKSWGQYKKSFLDNVIEKIRYSIISNHIKGPNILDLGCGFDAKLLTSIGPIMKNGVGVDVSVDPHFKSEGIKLITSKVDTKITLPSDSFDTVLSLATIEHVENPQIMVREIYRLLKKHGVLLLTTPASSSKVILETMARLGLISRREIFDHRRYYDFDSLTQEFRKAGFKKDKIEIEYFEAGLNMFAKATK